MKFRKTIFFLAPVIASCLQFSSCYSEPASPTSSAFFHTYLACIEILAHAHDNDGWTPEVLSEEYLVRSPDNKRVPLLYVGKIRLNLDDASESVPVLSTPFKIDGHYLVAYSDFQRTWEKINPLLKE